MKVEGCRVGQGSAAVAEQFKCNLVAQAREMPQQQFKKLGKNPTGASEASELIYFKVFKSQVPVIEQALQTSARMLGLDRSRGYCLENGLRRFFMR